MARVVITISDDGEDIDFTAEFSPPINADVGGNTAAQVWGQVLLRAIGHTSLVTSAYAQNDSERLTYAPEVGVFMTKLKGGSDGPC